MKEEVVRLNVDDIREFSNQSLKINNNFNYEITVKKYF